MASDNESIRGNLHGLPLFFARFLLEGKVKGWVLLTKYHLKRSKFCLFLPIV